MIIFHTLYFSYHFPQTSSLYYVYILLKRANTLGTGDWHTGHSCRGVNPESHSDGLWSIDSQAVLAPLQQLICSLPERTACIRRLLSAASASADKRSTALCGTTAPPAESHTPWRKRLAELSSQSNNRQRHLNEYFKATSDSTILPFQYACKVLLLC